MGQVLQSKPGSVVRVETSQDWKLAVVTEQRPEPRSYNIVTDSELQYNEQGFIIFSCFIHCNNMKILQLQLYVLISCQAAVADLLTDLGSNVTINCDLDEKEVYWILLKTPDPPTVILRSFSTAPSPFYPNKTFRKKYSVQSKHCLVINNVTADELGVSQLEMLRSQDVLRTSLLVSRTLPSDVPTTF
ncbi:hypothetical protein QQF64_018912 [Cirrhinus molitorella]|uniref:Uncharacterized protein n=1 Tax=Cirrhinus molitorella TaxID=172907 RepID=A0ABR3LGD4_9TELE